MIDLLYREQNESRYVTITGKRDNLNISHDDNINLDFLHDVIQAGYFSIYLLQNDISRIRNAKRITAETLHFLALSCVGETVLLCARIYILRDNGTVSKKDRIMHQSN